MALARSATHRGLPSAVHLVSIPAVQLTMAPLGLSVGVSHSASNPTRVRLRTFSGPAGLLIRERYVLGEINKNEAPGRRIFPERSRY